MIRGDKVTLLTKAAVGTDPFGAPVYELMAQDVDNVLVALPEAKELDDKGRTIAYVLGIPKGDRHEWKDQLIEWRGERYQAVGIPEVGIEANVPGPWHKKVKVVRYE